MIHKRIVILSTFDGYEALYIDGNLYDQGNPLGEGERNLYFLRLVESFAKLRKQILTSDDFLFEILGENDNEEIQEIGFHNYLDEYMGDYGWTE